MVQKAVGNNISDPEYSHPPFTERQMADIQRVKLILESVYPLTIGEWQNYLLCEENPASQLAWWISFADVYLEHTNGMPLDECRKTFVQLLIMTLDARYSRSEANTDE